MSSQWQAFASLAPAGGRLLVATPLLGDAHFSRTVLYLLEHDGGGRTGAAGLA
jgi:putative transcriptional regulator